MFAEGHNIFRITSYNVCYTKLLRFFSFVLWMGKSGGHIAIVGKKEYARGVAVKSTNRKHALGTSPFDIVHNSTQTTGVFDSGYAIFGFIEQDVHLFFAKYYFAFVGYRITSYNVCYTKLLRVRYLKIPKIANKPSAKPNSSLTVFNKKQIIKITTLSAM